MKIRFDTKLFLVSRSVADRATQQELEAHLGLRKYADRIAAKNGYRPARRCGFHSRVKHITSADKVACQLVFEVEGNYVRL